MRASALRSKAAPREGRAFLEHDADGVNDFLAQAAVAMQDPLIERVKELALSLGL
jgi:hypothetical protein